MITISTYRDGYKFTETYTIDQAKQELIKYGMPGVNKLSEKEVIKAMMEFLHEGKSVN